MAGAVPVINLFCGWQNSFNLAVGHIQPLPDRQVDNWRILIYISLYASFPALTSPVVQLRLHYKYTDDQSDIASRVVAAHLSWREAPSSSQN